MSNALYFKNKIRKRGCQARQYITVRIHKDEVNVKRHIIIGFMCGCVVSLLIVVCGWYGFSMLNPMDNRKIIAKNKVSVNTEISLIKETMPVKQAEVPTMLSSVEPTDIIENKQTIIPSLEPEEKILSKYEEYIQENEDIVGWISIPNTIIDYPVYYDSSPEYFYLEHNGKKEASKKGSICVQYNNSLAGEEFSKNTLIFGHNMKDGTMFHSINNYKKKGFFEQHPYIYFDNLKEEGIWKVFSVYYIDADKETVPDLFSSDDEYLKYLRKIQKRSIYPVEFEFNTTDKIITICTCSYEYNNGRTLVHAVLENDQEDKIVKKEQTR